MEASSSSRMDYCPEAAYLKSKAAENLSWNEALSELIDNAFDANANRCDIAITKDQVEIKDDGVGCDDLACFIALGKRRDRSTTDLGMHGRGVKDAWFWLSDGIDIESYHGGMCYRLSMSALELIESKWMGPTQTAIIESGRGTTVTFSQLQKRRTPKEQTLDDLGKRYMPALMDGRQIIVKCGNQRAKRIKPFAMPQVQDVVRDTFDVGGKSVSIDVGIVPEGKPNPVANLLFIRGYRVIMACAVGAGDFSTARIAGTVTLGKGWALSPHKDNISESIDELGAAIYERIKHVLEKAHRQYMTAESDAFLEAVEGLTEEGLKALRKEKRNGGASHPGSVKSKWTGRKRRNAQQTQDGNGSVEQPQSDAKRRKGIKIDVREDEQPDSLGCADPIRNRVTLNLSHPFVRSAWDSRNLLAIYSTAFGIFCQDRCGKGRRQAFMFDIHDFLSAWGIALKTGKWQGGLPDGQAG